MAVVEGFSSTSEIEAEANKANLQGNIEACLSALLDRQGGDRIDAVSFFLIDDIARNVALLLAVDVSEVRMNAGITRYLMGQR